MLDILQDLFGRVQLKETVKCESLTMIQETMNELTVLYQYIVGLTIFQSDIPSNSTYHMLKLKLGPHDCIGTEKKYLTFYTSNYN